MKKITGCALIATLIFSGPALAGADDDYLTSSVFLRAGFGGAAGQSTGLRYGLQYDFANTAGVESREPLTRFEFQGTSLVGMHVNGVNISTLIHSLSAVGLGGILNGSNLFLLGAAGATVAVASQSKPRDGDQQGFVNVIGDDNTSSGSGGTSGGGESNGGGSNGGGSGETCVGEGATRVCSPNTFNPDAPRARTTTRADHLQDDLLDPAMTTPQATR